MHCGLHQEVPSGANRAKTHYEQLNKIAQSITLNLTCNDCRAAEIGCMIHAWCQTVCIIISMS